MVGSNCEDPLYLIGDPRRRCQLGMSRDIRVSEICILILILQVFSPAKAIFAGISFLLLVCTLLNTFVRSVVIRTTQAAKDVRAGQDAFLEVFERIEAFFKRLEIYPRATLNQEMVDIITKIMVEVLDVLGIATKEIRLTQPTRPTASRRDGKQSPTDPEAYYTPPRPCSTAILRLYPPPTTSPATPGDMCRLPPIIQVERQQSHNFCTSRQHNPVPETG
jgi:hypothetical protein